MKVNRFVYILKIILFESLNSRIIRPGFFYCDLFFQNFVKIYEIKFNEYKLYVLLIVILLDRI